MEEEEEEGLPGCMGLSLKLTPLAPGRKKMALSDRSAVSLFSTMD